MFSNNMVIEAEMKAQSFMEQADHERQGRLAKMRNARPILNVAGCFLKACQAGWAAYRNSIQAARHNTV